MKRAIRDHIAIIAIEAHNANRLSWRHYALCWIAGVNVYGAVSGSHY